MDMRELDLLTTVPSSWFPNYGLKPADPDVLSGNPDTDPFTTFQEGQGDTDPTSAHSYFRIEGISIGPPVTVHFQTSSNRVYTLLSCPNLSEAGCTEVPGQTAVPGSGGMDALSDTNTAPARFYRVGVRVP